MPAMSCQGTRKTKERNVTRKCTVCKQVVLIEALQDPGGVCRDCYAKEPRSWTPTSSHRWREWVIPEEKEKTR